MKGIDCAFNTSAHLAVLKAKGISFVCRYYSYNTAKNLSSPEAKAITDAGMQVVSVWEARGDVYSAFNAPQGQKDAQEALILAAQCGQPKGSVIYFAVDFDASVDEVEGGITAYFAAVNAIVGNQYRIGVYGSGAVLHRLHQLGLASYMWLAQSTGWRGHSAVSPHIMQGPTTNSFLSGYADTDDAATSDFGGWAVGGAAIPDTKEASPSTNQAPAAPTEDEVIATIALLQRQLQALSLYTGKIDGIYGPRTQAAILAFQKA